MDGWDWALLAVASYVAVAALVQLMLGHRDRLVKDIRQKLQAEDRRRKRAAPPPVPESKSRDRAA